MTAKMTARERIEILDAEFDCSQTMTQAEWVQRRRELEAEAQREECEPTAGAGLRLTSDRPVRVVGSDGKVYIATLTRDGALDTDAQVRATALLVDSMAMKLQTTLGAVDSVLARLRSDEQQWRRLADALYLVAEGQRATSKIVFDEDGRPIGVRRELPR